MNTNKSIFALWLTILLAQPVPAAEPVRNPASDPADAQIVITPAQQQTAGIRVVPLEVGGALASQRFAGEVVIPVMQERVVTAPQSGLVAELKVAAGQTVKKGQPLARISSPEMVVLQSEYLQALTRHQLAADMLMRDEELYQEGIIAERRFLATQSQHAEASAVLAQHRQALQLAGMSDAAIAQLQKSGRMNSGLTLTAPMDGQVLEQMARTGQRVELSMPLYRIAQLSPLWVEIRAPLKLLDVLQPGLTVKLPQAGVEGRLISVIRSVNRNDQTLQLRAEVTAGAEKLIPGQYVEVEIVSSDAAAHGRPVYVLPKAAVVRSGNAHYIFVQNAQGFIATAVEILSEKSGKVAFRADLKGNEQVAVAGTVALKGKWLGVGDE